MDLCAAIRGYSAGGRGLTFLVLFSASLQWLSRGGRVSMRGDDVDISAMMASTSAASKALGVERPIASIGRVCDERRPCGPREVLDEISCLAPDGSLCKQEGCTCRRPEGAVCVADSDCAHGCGHKNGQCVCLSATDSHATAASSASDVNAANQNSCARSTCKFGLNEAFVCEYNAWSDKYREVTWESSSMFHMLRSETQPVHAGYEHRTNEAILQRFLGGGKYAGKYTLDELYQRIQQGLYISATNQILRKAVALESIPVSYELTHISELLETTEKLAKNASFMKRYTTTAATMQDILTGLMHKTALGLWKAFELGLKHSRYNANYMDGRWGVSSGPAISMEGILWTELTFSVVPVDSMHRENARISEYDMDSLAVLYSVIGNALGVNYQFATWKAAKEIFERLKAGPDHCSRFVKKPEAVNKLLKVFSEFRPQLEESIR